ncbi:E3 ubiquitin/ISG15 ligase TRIM25-like [Hyperolius riggenbachi]|uniref:E3 ubiquitin/ISG15 ligase TRIM25-like n=1 Tax=Hyperolius riggenbachi TaxID=752182 RepID=UPI0035A3CA26
MASADPKEDLTCSVCMEIYKDPVTLPCGHNFCRVCILRTWDNQDEGESQCPECIRRYKRKPELMKNVRLANLCDLFNWSCQLTKGEIGMTCSQCIDFPRPAVKSCLTCEVSLCDKHLQVHSRSTEHIFLEPTMDFEGRKCPEHNKILEFYCTEDNTCICVYCHLGEKHIKHKTQSLEEASKKKIDKLRSILEKLIPMNTNVDKKVNRLQHHVRTMREKSGSLMERVTALFMDIRKQLEDLEKRVLSDLSQQEEQIANSVSGMIQQLETKKDELSRKIHDIEELCNTTNPVAILQHPMNTSDFYDPKGDDHGEERESRDEELLVTGNVDEELISQMLHKGFAEALSIAEKRCDVPQSSDILPSNTATIDHYNIVALNSPDMSTVQEESEGVNTPSDIKIVSEESEVTSTPSNEQIVPEESEGTNTPSNDQIDRLHEQIDRFLAVPQQSSTVYYDYCDWSDDDDYLY